MAFESPNPIILYDGVCGLCNRLVQFVLKRDVHDRFRFATLQSESIRRILQRHGINSENLESVYLVLDCGKATERILVSSTASIHIFRELGVFWRTAATLLALCPWGPRDWGYNIIARNRYRLFGKYDTCPLPKASDRHKFLDAA